MSQWSVAFNEKCLQNIKNTLNKIKDDEIRRPPLLEKKNVLSWKAEPLMASMLSEVYEVKRRFSLLKDLDMYAHIFLPPPWSEGVKLIYNSFTIV